MDLSKLPKPDWQTADGRFVLYNRDCMEVLPQIPTGVVDAVVTDPPYGIKAARANFFSRGNLVPATDFGHGNWDDQPIDYKLLSSAIALGKWGIVWGGNYYPMPPSSCWLIWDKRHRGQDFADAELAWTNLPGAVRKFEFLWAGMWQENMKCKEQRVHPTQKPVPLMQWCIEKIPNANVVFDPLMGSGSTGIACHRLGRSFIGIELEPKYFDIACRRIENELSRAPLFEPQPVVQRSMFADEAK